MNKPISKEQREAAQEWAANMPFAVSRWLRGYEALLVDLEQKIEDKSLKMRALTEEMISRRNR